MLAAAYTRTDQDKWLSLGLALAVHVVLAVMLVWGLSWQNREPTAAMEAELWAELPSAPTMSPPRQQSRPAVEKPSKPQPPAPEEVRPEPVQPVKPDIALKQAEKKPEKKPEKAVEKMPEKVLDKKLAPDPLLQELQRQQAQLQKQQAQAAAQAASANARVVGDFKDRIRAKIHRNVIVPPSIVGNPEAVFEVTLLPGGSVLNVRLVKSSGQPEYDVAVERAIRKSEPLPLPPDASLFNEFRELTLRFRPVE